MIPAVAIAGFRNLLSLALDVSARQVIEQHIELSVEQIRPALPEMREQLLLMLQDPIQTAIQAILLRYGKILSQQFPHGAAIEPLPMNTKFAARIEQPIDHQQPQNLLPVHRLAPDIFLQPLLPELLQIQLPP